MLKEDFILDNRISNAVPKDASSRILRAGAFCTAIDEFLSDNFRGCVKTEPCSFNTESIIICPDYAAYFFKLLLCDIYGRVFLNIKFSYDQNFMIIRITSGQDLPISDTEMRLLIKTARNAGMEILPGKQEIALTVRYKNAYEHRVYAISISGGKEYILGKLDDMFFFDAPMTNSK